jgi:YcxB-like protein
MEVRYQCTLSDYREAQYTHQKRSIVTYLLFAGGIFFLAVGVGVHGAFWELFVGTFLLLSPILFHLFWLRQVQNSPAFGQAISLRPGTDGLYSTGEMGQGTLKWSAFIRFQETRNQFMLYMSQSAFYVIPKRAFSGPEMEEFRSLLTQYIPRK